MNPHITHTFDHDLNISLIGPDGTVLSFTPVLRRRGRTARRKIRICNPFRTAVLPVVLSLALGCALTNVRGQSVGGPTTLISQDFQPVRSSMAVDSFGDIYIAYDVSVSRTPTPTGVVETRELRLARSTDGGATFTVRAVASGQTRVPSLAVSAAGNIYIAYLSGLPCDGAQDCRDRPASKRTSIQVISSPDGGETFSSPVQVSTPGITNVDWETNVAVDAAGKVYVVWSESDTTDPEASFNYSLNFVKLRTSSDKAKTFSPPVVIQSDPGTRFGEQFIPGFLTNPNIAVTPGGQIHVTWSECKTNDCSEYYYRRSLDGESFSAPLLIDQNVESVTFGGHDIAVDAAGRVSVVYAKDETSFTTLLSNVYHARIENGVVTDRTHISSVRPEFLATDPTVAIDGLGRIWVAWSGPRPDARSRSEPNDIFVRRSINGGRTFSAPANISNTPASDNGRGHSYSPALAIGLGGTPLIVWGDNVPFCSVNCFSRSGELRFRGALDSDGDGLPDYWETDGVVIDGVLIDLPKMGADSMHKDLFVHADWMQDDPNRPGAKFKPTQRAMKMVTDAFEAAPVDNPDGETGVHLHVDVGPDSVMNPVTGEKWGALSQARDVPFEAATGSFTGNLYDWARVDAIKAMHFTPARRRGVFRYALFCNTYGGSASSGIARGILSSDFLVTLGAKEFSPPGGTAMEQAGTFMHEFGHTLGLLHGGNDDIHRKPNYLSVMNYSFQFGGLLLPNGQRSFDYSNATLPTLDERSLSEDAGITDPAMRRTFWNLRTRLDIPAGSNKCLTNRNGYYAIFLPALDWNCDGQKTPGAVIADINGDGICVSPGENDTLDSVPAGDDEVIGGKITSGQNRTCETSATGDDQQDGRVGFVEPNLLNGFNDWPAIAFDGGGKIGDPGAGVPDEAATPDDEPRIDQILDATPPALREAEQSAPLDVVTTSARKGTAPLTVEFDGSASTSPNGNIVEWLWDFGDGATASGATVTHTYNATGKYLAKLTVTDNTGRLNLVPLLYHVSATPATPTPTPTPAPTPCGSDSITGRVTDGSGNGLGGVTMTLQVGTETRTTQTDSNGNYSFRNLSAGAAYRVTASKLRFLFPQPRQGFDNLIADQAADFSGMQVNFRGDANGKIAFASARDSVGNSINFEIYVADSAGSNQTRLTNTPGNDLRPAWSPDGTKLAFVSQRDGNLEIYVMNSDGSQQTRLTDNSASDDDPAWSPDGRKIAFASNREGSTAIYVMNADGGAVTRLTSDSRDDRGPTWSPPGTKLAFESRRDGNAEIYTINADGTFLKRLTENEAPDQHPSWSPDGAKIVFDSNRDGKYEIYLMDANGGTQVRLTDNPAFDSEPAWSPDGMKIVFDSERDGSRGIYTMSSAGGNIIRVTDQLSFNSTADWQSLPAPPPTILSFSPPSGLPGSSVTIFGSNFTGTAAVQFTVQFNGAASSFAVDSATQVIATVPMGATSGPISVTTAAETASSSSNFIVLADSDGDGVSDDFEQQYFGNPTVGDPAADSDGDGETNLQEYLAGTNPLDPKSVLRITEIRRQGNDIVIVFESRAGKRYRVEACSHLTDNFPIEIATISRAISDQTLEIIDIGGATHTRRFYRAVVLP